MQAPSLAGRLVGYPGSAESVDASKGLKVRLDGFSKREWVTDDDEWEWIDVAVGADGTRPLEHFLGSVLRQYIVRLAQGRRSGSRTSPRRHCRRLRRVSGRRPARRAEATRSAPSPRRRRGRARWAGARI
mmetsp:Transcript_38714/g.129509  ORF Transcript_38714/g.129509 Transcript_38714/m.129509 type:complete len:130 (-) Transcript_38714:246-635(-)